MDSIEQMNIWTKQWEKAQRAWDKEEKKRPVRTSFFNDLPMDHDYVEHDPSQEEIGDWIDIYNRTLEGEDQVISEDGFGDLVRGDKQMTKGDITYYTQPNHISAVGPDQGNHDEPMRVSQYAAATSPELEKLDGFKRKIEVLERRAHRADVMGESSKKSKLKNELKSLRKQVHELSELLQSQPDKDVT